MTIDNMERKQQSQKVQRDFAEALKDGKSKGGRKKKVLSIDENSIVSRILGEVGRQSEAKLGSPKVVRLEEILKENKESGGRREKTLSVCSDNIPDLCPIEDEDNQEDEEASTPVDDLEEEEGGCTLSKKNFYKSGSIFFMTDFDDVDDDSEAEDDDGHKSNSDEELFADAEEHLASEEKSKLKPFIREILDSSLSDSDLIDCRDSSEILETLSSKLVSPISSLVQDLVKEELTSSSYQVMTAEVMSPMDILEESSDLTAATDIIPDTDTGDSQTVYDVFDLSMKRLDFIENSFKTIYSEESEPPAIENKEDSLEEKMMKIRQVLSVPSTSDEKIKEIERILNIPHDK